MKHLSLIIENDEQIFEFLRNEPWCTDAISAKSILVQIFTGNFDEDRIKQIVSVIHSIIPKAVVIGATSAGEISEGHVTLESTIVSFSFFQSSDLFPVSQDCQIGEEYQCGIVIARSFSTISYLKGILLLAPPSLINCARLLDGINSFLPEIQVFGGVAAGINSKNALVSLNDVFFNEGGVVAIALAGEDLYFESHAFLGWKSLGPRITLTDVKGFDMLTIDGNPAFDAYRKYLSLEPGDDLFLLELALLIERNGMILARNPVSSGNICEEHVPLRGELAHKAKQGQLGR